MEKITKDGVEVQVSPMQKKRIQAIISIRSMLDSFSPHDRLSICLMAATKMTEELFILHPDAKRGKLIKAAEADFGRMLQAHVAHTRPPNLDHAFAGSGPSSEIPEGHPLHKGTDPDKTE
jgi:hypothetical protein